MNRRLNGALAFGLIALFLLIHPIAAFASSSFVALSQSEAALNNRSKGRSKKTQLFNKDAEGNLPQPDPLGDDLNTDKFRGGATPPPLPTMSQYLKFALPCLGLWIAQPLLSLVDTSFVGLSSGGAGSARQLAALGPATTFFDGATYLFAFLNVATTNLYSSAKAEKGIRSDKAESVVRTSSRVAFRCGLGIMTFLLLFSRPLLELYMGSQAAATPGLLDAATDYVKIRALSLPTSLLLGVLQAALLGAQDSVTPLIAIVYCTVVNVVMDYVLVSRVGWGLQGAAIATTFAQWAATAALIPAAKRKLLKTRKLELWKKRVPSKDGVTGKAFLGFAAPVLTLILGKLAAYGFMTNTAAGVPGQPIPLAAHQIILSLLFACAPFLEVLSQTAQTFLPQYLAPARKLKGEAAEPWIAAGQKVATNLLGMSVFIAGAVASLAALVPAYFGNWITTDTVVQKAIQPMAKYLWFGAFIWAPIAVSEGVLLGRLQLGFLATIYLLSTALLPPALLQIKFRGGSVEHVWAAFCVFQLFRALTFTGRIWGGYALRRKPKPTPAKA